MLPYDNFHNYRIMDTSFCSYCSSHYNLSNRLPQCLSCGHTYCISCNIYFYELKGKTFCPVCNNFEEISNCDMNIIDQLKVLYFCMIHNLPILYSNREIGFACEACKEQASNLAYDKINERAQQMVYDKIKECKFDADAEKNIISVQSILEEKLKKIKEEKNREIAEIKKRYKAQKNNIKECLKLLNKAKQIHSQSYLKSPLNLNLNLICVISQKKFKEKQSNTDLVHQISHEKKYSFEEHIRFANEKKNWNNLWAGANLYIFFNSFYNSPSSPSSVHIKKTLRITLLKPLFGGEQPRNLAAIGLSLPVNNEGSGEYSIMGIYVLNQGVFNPILQRLNPISVSYDPKQCVTYYDLNQQVILIDSYTYYLVYEYYGPPTYLGVIPSVSNGNFSFAEVDIDSSKEFICTEGQIQYLILHALG